MRTALYVYQTTLININTSESDLQLCGMNAATVPLAAGDNARTIAPGIYKILSCHEIKVDGDTSAFETVTTNDKDNDPTPPARATAIFAPLNNAALNAFMVAPDAKAIMNP
jgi:acid stress-induced BolA-like protein IbaG/YrbA